MSIDTQAMTFEEYIGAVQLMGILLYFFIPTIIFILSIYFIRKHIGKKKATKNKKGNQYKSHHTDKLDINTASDKELISRIDNVESHKKPEIVDRLALKFDKDGKIEQ